MGYVGIVAVDLERRGDIACAGIVAEQTLHMIVNRGLDRIVVEIDEVGTPLRMPLLGQQGCV